MALPERLTMHRLAQESQMAAVTAMPEQAAQLKRIADYLYAIAVHMGALQPEPTVPSSEPVGEM